MKEVAPIVAVALPLPHSVAFGGRELLAIKTMEALADLGIDIRPLEYWDRSAQFRALHCFGSEGGLWEIAARVKKQGKPIIVSPVLVLGRSIVRERAWAHLDPLVPMRTSFRYRRDLLLLADAVIAQTDAEAHAIRTAFGVSRKRVHVIPNGVDPSFDDSEPGPFRARYGADSFVLAVGAIDARKGQLDLVEATTHAGKRAVIVGDVQGDDAYGRAFAAAVAENAKIVWIRRLDEGSTMLASAYAAADAFVVTSRAEGLPLAALEARASGARLVMTDLPQHTEVFAGNGEFFRPGDIKALAEILRRLPARDRQGIPILQESWTWTDVGHSMREVYRQVCPDVVPNR